MRLCVILSRLTGWGLDDVRSVKACEVKDWLDAALEVEKAMTGK
ncbi:hypothetical protein [uncultured Mailhella sp.]|nr:hypothetical protein [uncultured Mailhella sp.]